MCLQSQQDELECGACVFVRAVSLAQTSSFTSERLFYKRVYMFVPMCSDFMGAYASSCASWAVHMLAAFHRCFYICMNAYVWAGEDVTSNNMYLIRVRSHLCSCLLHFGIGCDVCISMHASVYARMHAYIGNRDRNAFCKWQVPFYNRLTWAHIQTLYCWFKMMLRIFHEFIKAISMVVAASCKIGLVE